ncbi:para-aminobenzoate synthetase component 1 [Micrococcales bacterium KH10]|nr:para-aminobenzoate synthetase component 1 [Micrococcales bacterium KH10]
MFVRKTAVNLSPDSVAIFRGHARFGDQVWINAVESIDVVAQPERLNEGIWLLVATFEGKVTAWRFTDHIQVKTSTITPATNAAQDLTAVEPSRQGPWHGPDHASWHSSMTKDEYCAAVNTVRHHVHEGQVYQANICRVLQAPLDPAQQAARGDIATEPKAEYLWQRLDQGNPAPYGGFIHVPEGLIDDHHDPIEPIWVVTASPELYVRVESDGSIASSPIKGTAPTAAELLEKDRAENIMITDLVRNDLQRVCEPGSITVDPLLAVEHHPGLVHLVSTVRGKLLTGDGDVDWKAVLATTFPPGSVSGAPKESALSIISALEPSQRGPYCGAIGWIDGDSNTAELAVGIRTFWWQRDKDGRGWLRFGTGAGITWESDAEAEWEETQLKAHRLVGLASSRLDVTADSSRDSGGTVR